MVSAVLSLLVTSLCDRSSWAGCSAKPWCWHCSLLGDVLGSASGLWNQNKNKAVIDVARQRWACVKRQPVCGVWEGCECMECVTHSQSHCFVIQSFPLANVAPANIAVGRREISQAGNKAQLTGKKKNLATLSTVREIFSPLYQVQWNVMVGNCEHPSRGEMGWDGHQDHPCRGWKHSPLGWGKCLCVLGSALARDN